MFLLSTIFTLRSIKPGQSVGRSIVSRDQKIVITPPEVFRGYLTGWFLLFGLQVKKPLSLLQRRLSSDWLWAWPLFLPNVTPRRNIFLKSRSEYCLWTGKPGRHVSPGQCTRMRPQSEGSRLVFELVNICFMCFWIFSYLLFHSEWRQVFIWGI